MPNVAVIGGGLAGLEAARQLRHAGMKPIILEASDRLGGRIRQGITTYEQGGDTYEQGGEFFHGGEASAHALAHAARLPTARVFTAAHGDGGPDDEPAPDGGHALYWLGKEGPCLRYDSSHASFRRLNESLGGLSELAVSADDWRSLEDYLRERVPAEMLPLAKASYSNTLGAGAALGRMPLAAVAALERRWLADGEGDFRLCSGRKHATRATEPQPGCNLAATWLQPGRSQGSLLSVPLNLLAARSTEPAKWVANPDLDPDH
jgi:monoamine oxidase